MLDVRLSVLVFYWTSQCSLMDNCTSCHRVAVTRAISDICTNNRAIRLLTSSILKFYHADRPIDQVDLYITGMSLTITNSYVLRKFSCQSTIALVARPYKYRYSATCIRYRFSILVSSIDY